MTVFAIAVFVIAYGLIASEKVHRVKVALTGAALMLAAGVVDFEHAFHSEETGVDWEVILLLLGMMIIVGVLSHTGVFEYIAIRAVKSARGRPFRVMALLVLITAVASAALDNVTTVLLIAPVTLLVCNRLGLNPVPYLLAEVFASNVGGAATLIGDPPNIIIAGRAGLSFNDFLVHLAPVVVVLLAALLLLCRVLFRSAFVHDPERAAEVMELDEREAINDPRLLVKCGVVLLGVLIGFVISATTGTAPATVALLGAGVLVLISGLPPRDYLADVEAPTLLFFVGLFIMVGALIEVGVIGQLAEWATEATGGDVGTATFLLLGVSAVLSADRGQHPVRGHHGPAGGVPGGVHRQPAGRPVVVARPRRRPRRQRDDHRGQRERRHAGDRREERLPDQLLAVREVRRRGHAGDRAAVRPLLVAALLRARMSPSADG